MSKAFLYPLAFVITFTGLFPSSAISNVYLVLPDEEKREWTFGGDLHVSQDATSTTVAGADGLKWSFPFPFRIHWVVELAGRTEVVISAATLTNGNFINYAFIAHFKKCEGQWYLSTPLLDQQLLEPEEAWIDRISMPLNAPERLIVRFAKHSEWIGGKRSVQHVWRYLNVENGELGDPFIGEFMPHVVLE
jgi:hypothetical protein